MAIFDKTELLGVKPAVTVYHDVVYLPRTQVVLHPLSIPSRFRSPGAIKRPRTRSTTAQQVSNTLERDLVTNQNV